MTKANKKKSNKQRVIHNQRQLNREIKKNEMNTRKFLEIEAIKSNYILTTTKQEQYYIKTTPFNISIMSTNKIANIEDDLSEILSAIPRAEIICINSTQSYDENKEYLNLLSKTEKSATIRDINQKDVEHLNTIKRSMATSRSFYIRVNCNSADSESDKNKKIDEAMQILRSHNYEVVLAEKKELKKMLAIYLEQNVYTEDFPDYDGEQYGISDDDAQELNLKSFVDLVAPSKIEFKRNPTYYILGGTFRTVYAIRSYPTTTTRQHLLKSLGEQDGVTLHIYSNVLNTSERSKAFSNAEKRNRSVFSTAKTMENKQQGIENLTDLQQLISTAHKTNETFVNCAVFIEMIANSLDGLKELRTKVDGFLLAANITKDPLYTQQRDGFVSVAPFGFNIFNQEFLRVLPASSVANLFPFSYSGKTDKQGIYIGKDVNGSNIIVDFDKRASDKTNGHISIFGNSGEGKSYLMKLLLIIFLQQQKNVYICDVDREFEEPTMKLGGTNIDMLLGKYFINVMEPKVNVFDEDSDDEFIVNYDTKAIISQHIAFIRAFFEAYKPEMTSSQLDVLEILVAKTYKRFGITEDIDLSSVSSSQFPILSDLYETAYSELNNYDDINASSEDELLYTKDLLRTTALALSSICVGADSHFFNGHTNIPTGNFINFILKGMLTSNENVKNAMYFNVFSYMQHKFFTEGKTAVFLDELHEIIKSKIVVNYIRSFIKRGRKKDSNVVLASQNIDDIMLPGIIEYTRPLFSIPTHMFLFYPGKVQIEQFMDITGLSRTEYKLIGKSRRGHAFYMCGNERYHIEIKVPIHKSCLFGSAGGR